MCGFIGFSSSFNFLKYKSRLKRASELIVHRGPDAEGLFFSENSKIGFAHRRLSIIDIDSRSNQPFISDCGRFSIVYNGEIYNFSAIKSLLLKKGYKFKTHSDTEVLLYAYIEYGKKILLKLNGIFAFAIYDSFSDSLFIARDRFGIKPLYYFQDKDEIVFSSEIKPISYLIGKKNKINKKALFFHTKYIFNPLNETIFSGIKKLDPGYLINISTNNQLNVEQWYKPSFKKNSNYSYTDALKKFEKIFKDSIHSQLITDVKLGAFLSGGLDSSSIVYFMREEIDKFPLYTIDTNFSNEDGFVDDLPYAIKLAKKFKLELNIIKIKPDDFIADLEKIVEYIEEPLADPAALNTFHICKKAKKDSVKVLLSGTGGDDILAGYRRHFSMKYFDTFNLFFKLLNFNNNKFFKSSNSFFRRLNKFQDIYDPDVNQRITNYFNWTDDKLLKNIFADNVYSKIFSKDFDSNILKTYLNNHFPNLSQLDKQLCLEQRFFLNDHNLLYTDRMSMANNIEIRVPFLNHDLVNFTNSIDDKFKINSFKTKYILKEFMKDKLPDYIVNRKKTGFGLPIRSWIKKEFRPIINEYLSEKNIKQQGIFNYNGIRDVIKDNQSGLRDSSYLIFSLIFFQIWYKKFFE